MGHNGHYTSCPVWVSGKSCFALPFSVLRSLFRRKVLNGYDGDDGLPFFLSRQDNNLIAFFVFIDIGKIAVCSGGIIKSNIAENQIIRLLCRPSIKQIKILTHKCCADTL